MQKFYKHPWTQEKSEQLIKWWPHWGTYVMAPILELKRSQVKAKVNKLKLILLPKNERICTDCKIEFQFNRRGGLKCRKCYSISRRNERIKQDSNLDPKIVLINWFKRVMRTIRYRESSTNLTFDFLNELWDNQNGKCFYSNIEMIPLRYGQKRGPYSPSLERLDSNKGHTIDNVAWVIWGCNAGKNEWSLKQYIDICKAVIYHHENLGTIHDS